jgi:hypothetical protein
LAGRRGRARGAEFGELRDGSGRIRIGDTGDVHGSVDDELGLECAGAFERLENGHHLAGGDAEGVERGGEAFDGGLLVEDDEAAFASLTSVCVLCTAVVWPPLLNALGWLTPCWLVTVMVSAP